MEKVTLHGDPISISGKLPENGTKAPEFNLTKADLSKTNLAAYEGSKVILNIFPSIDTGVCASSVRHFNESASKLDNTKVLCISKDLPFAQARFCGAEGIKNVEMLSDFSNGQFGKDYGLEMTEGPLSPLHARAVIALDENHRIIYSELVPEIVQEPNYEAALNAIK